jgi:membrane-bound lytic murein transglycosylase B
MKPSLCLPLWLLFLHVTALGAATINDSGLTAQEREKEIALRDQLCSDKNLSCEYVNEIFADPRLIVFPPPGSTPPPTSERTHERNPYLTKRFALLTTESLERCRSFMTAHAGAFETAFASYGVPPEIICGHLRLETNFGIPTALAPHPLGSAPAVSRLISLYIRPPRTAQSKSVFVRRQKFAVQQLSILLATAAANGWDLFLVAGSPTGAIGLAQFEPSAFCLAVDGNGDGVIDLFNPEDAILSVAHYLVSRGWDGNPEHQKRAVYAYYGGHYNTDPDKFYMKAVLKYANEVRAYLADHPVDTALSSDFRHHSRLARTPPDPEDVFPGLACGGLC